MSFHGGTAIFKPVCAEIVKQVQDEGLDPLAAESILTVFIETLRDSDWGDPEEGLWAFPNASYVVAAFKANGIEDDLCEGCGELRDNHCDLCGECDCDGEECDDAEDEFEGEEEQALITKDK